MPEHTPAPTPHRAVYGFAFYLLFFTLSILYALWALLPTERLGLTYLPDKYFALYLPVVVLTGLSVFIFFIYPAICASLTPEVDSIATVTDVASVRRICGHKEDTQINGWEDLKCIAPKTTKPNSNLSETLNECAICKVVHTPSKMEPIATLRFIDLAEVNDSIFGS